MANTNPSIKVTDVKQDVYNWLIDQAATRKKQRSTDRREGVGTVVKEILDREYHKHQRRAVRQQPQEA